VLPDVKGIYNDDKIMIDGLLISHPHQDHYGLYNFLNPAFKCYLGRATHKLIEINNLFTPKNTIISNPVYFEKEIAFQIGDITITPFWADHSAFDSYSFQIEADGKSIFYSGDFRGHGRKSKAFKWFTNNAPSNVDYLLLEGTSLGRDGKPFKNEMDIENELVAMFKTKGKSNLIYTSGQNIDRIVSIYRACIRSEKILVVDVYVATILKELSEFAKIPYPSDDFKNLKVIYPYYTSKRLANQGSKKILYQFKNFKIDKEEISSQPDKYVMIVRPSMQKDLDYITGIDGGNLIYSMWEGYMKKNNTKTFLEYFIKRAFSIHNIHTSGHADTDTLKKMVEAIKPKFIVPIHTFSGSEYHKIFITPIIEMNDGETRLV
jgi:ribonuclease J